MYASIARDCSTHVHAWDTIWIAVNQTYSFLTEITHLISQRGSYLLLDNKVAFDERTKKWMQYLGKVMHEL